MEIIDDSSFPRMVKLLDQNNEPTTIFFRDIKFEHEHPGQQFYPYARKGCDCEGRSLP